MGSGYSYAPPEGRRVPSPRRFYRSQYLRNSGRPSDLRDLVDVFEELSRRTEQDKDLVHGSVMWDNSSHELAVGRQAPKVDHVHRI